MSSTKHLPVPVSAGQLVISLPARALSARTIEAALGRVAPHLNGSTGARRKRDGTALTQADTDLEAIREWIAVKTGSVHTRRLYKREAHRFLLYMLACRGHQLADVSTADVKEYKEWLRQGLPGPGWPTRWKVFSGRGGLSDASRQVATNVLKGLYTYLCNAGYLTGNPFVVVGEAKTEAELQQRLGGKALDKTKTKQLKRFFQGPLWRWLRQRLDTPYSPEAWPDIFRMVKAADGKEVGFECDGEPPPPEDPALAEWPRGTWRRHAWSPARVERLRFIVLFAYYTAARRSELAAANMAQIGLAEDEDGEAGWVWSMVHAKGKAVGEARDLDLSPREMAILRRYRESRGLPPDPRPDEAEVPLVASLTADYWGKHVPGGFVTDELLSQELKACFRQCARVAEAQQRPHWARTLRAASAHWLRHTYGSHGASAGIHADELADRMGHSDIQTTRKYYIHRDRKRSEAEREKLAKFNPD